VPTFACLEFGKLAFYLRATYGGRPLACPHCLLLGDRGGVRGALGVVPSELSLLSSDSRMVFGECGGLSRYRTDGETIGREDARGDTYEDISSTHGKLLLLFSPGNISASDVPSRKVGRISQVRPGQGDLARTSRLSNLLCNSATLPAFLEPPRDSPPQLLFQ